MTDILPSHKPRWQLDGADWIMIIGNRTVATLMPNRDPIVPWANWLSLIDDDFEDDGWDAVDFETLEIAKYTIEQWWFHMCRGEAFCP